MTPESRLTQPCVNPDLTYFLGTVQNRGDRVVKGSFTVVPWSLGGDAQGSVVGLYTTKVSRGCASTVWHLPIYVVCLRETHLEQINQVLFLKNIQMKSASLAISRCQSEDADL